MSESPIQALWHNFLGPSPLWYKQAMIGFLILNPILLITAGPFLTGWALIGEFIFTLALALRCYPLQPGGLLAIEAIIIGLAKPETVYHEAAANFEVILLLMFMVAGIYFMKDLLLYVFTKILLNVRSKKLLSLMFSLVAAVLSAFLDALTVTAVLISVGVGFYAVYHKVASGKHHTNEDHDHANDETVTDTHYDDLEQFRAFLRSLLMHGAVGTALGGVCTLVGEPQNLLIATVAGWDVASFLANWDAVLEDFAERESARANPRSNAKLVIQAVVALILVASLALHLAAVGLIGLMVIVLLTAFNGITEEHQLGHAFEEALPFTALLVVFFAIVAVIHEQHLFTPVIDAVLHMEASVRPAMFFVANGVLSMISDNVFVATVYISEVKAALDAGEITRAEFDQLAVAINTGTNLPSVATPNGQAAFLFLLTSAVAPLIRLSYGRMVIMALPYTFVLGGVGLGAVILFI